MASCATSTRWRLTGRPGPSFIPEGLWKATDAGKSWARISPADWIVNALLLEADRDSSRPSRLVIGTERQGVVLSDDGGANFRSGNEGFFHRRVLAVAVDVRDARRV